MCGIIGAVSQKNITNELLEGLKRLEYRGYDSAGMAVIAKNRNIECHRIVGKVKNLEKILQKKPLTGCIGIAHTRWATHGKPTERNAHPHIVNDEIAVVHNGIIENHESLRTELIKKGCILKSETDSELIAHLVFLQIESGQDFLMAVQCVAKQLQGAYAIGIICKSEPERLIALRSGSPLLIGLGEKENFIASDPMALLAITKKFIYLEENDIADIQAEKITIYADNGEKVNRPVTVSTAIKNNADKSPYPHFMLKEIFEQPDAVTSLLEERISQKHLLADTFGPTAEKIFSKIQRVQIVACGTSFHAGLIARYWLEEIAGIPCQVEIASEKRYRPGIIEPHTLFVTLSQSGETADTIGALREAKKLGFAATLTICNAPESTLCRESDLVLLMRAGPEIGVASTKSFTSQLAGLMLLTIALGRYHRIDSEREIHLIKSLRILPSKIKQILQLDSSIQELAKKISAVQNILFIARNIEFPVALESALKLKEIAYIHADAYPAGELKHGPLALVDANMFVIALAPHNELLDKLKSNLQEIMAREGKLIIFSDTNFENSTNILLPVVDKFFTPFVYIIPLQLLAYHVGVLKGIDVDQPRNLAKSVTVE